MYSLYEQIKLLEWQWTLAWRSVVKPDPTKLLLVYKNWATVAIAREIKGKQSFSYSVGQQIFNVTISGT